MQNLDITGLQWKPHNQPVKYGRESSLKGCLKDSYTHIQGSLCLQERLDQLNETTECRMQTEYGQNADRMQPECKHNDQLGIVLLWTHRNLQSSVDSLAPDVESRTASWSTQDNCSTAAELGRTPMRPLQKLVNEIDEEGLANPSSTSYEHVKRRMVRVGTAKVIQ